MPSLTWTPLSSVHSLLDHKPHFQTIVKSMCT
uniref:Uncharacterized protein n=1 Tax=Anguilla anguilla TaxID=7936 RepID=A0A0E9XP08_ANGAN